MKLEPHPALLVLGWSWVIPLILLVIPSSNLFPCLRLCFTTLLISGYLKLVFPKVSITPCHLKVLLSFIIILILPFWNIFYISSPSSFLVLFIPASLYMATKFMIAGLFVISSLPLLDWISNSNLLLGNSPCV